MQTFKPVVANLSTSMFSIVPDGSVETSILVSSSWWLDIYSSFHLLDFGIGFLLGAHFGTSLGSMCGYLVLGSMVGTAVGSSLVPF